MQTRFTRTCAAHSIVVVLSTFGLVMLMLKDNFDCHIAPGCLVSESSAIRVLWSAQVDTVVDIGLLIVGDMRTQLSFGLAPDGVAKAVAKFGRAAGCILSLADFEDLTYNVDGYTGRDMHAPRSASLL
eukprot:scaffold359151_cov19-Prasinocladus_malaysianus.AAC.2